MKLFVKIKQPLNQGNPQKTIGGGVKKRVFHNKTFDEIISLENLLEAWYEFRKGKRGKADVQEFELYLENNIFKLHNELKSGKYQHSKYYQFRICDPKPRLISKASVKDRLLHHAIYRVLYPNFDQTFIFDSYSCRKNKGTHKAFKRLADYTRKISKNYTKPCWAIKLDIKKFFDSIDHQILIELLRRRVDDKKLINLLINIIHSFHTKANKGIPIGNLTSQLFTNIYMDPLDKFIKHRLKAKYYLRYADDFILLSTNPNKLLGYLKEINSFLKEHLKLNLHQNKIILRKLNWGIDFVGYVNLLHYNLPRKRTVERIFKKLEQTLKQNPEKLDISLQSYLGYLKHVNGHKVSQELKKFEEKLKKIDKT